MPIKKVYHTTSGSLYTFDELHLVDVSCASLIWSCRLLLQKTQFFYINFSIFLIYMQVFQYFGGNYHVRHMVNRENIFDTGFSITRYFERYTVDLNLILKMAIFD